MEVDTPNSAAGLFSGPSQAIMRKLDFSDLHIAEDARPSSRRFSEDVTLAPSVRDANLAIAWVTILLSDP